MSIRRISELDLFDSSTLSTFLSTQSDGVTLLSDEYGDTGYDYAKLSVGLLFEVSSPKNGLSCLEDGEWVVKPGNEDLSYYLSKKITAMDLENIFSSKSKALIRRIINGPINYYGSQNFGNQGKY